MSKKKPHYPDDPTLTLNVNFGNVSAGDKTCRIGCVIDRQSLTLNQADKQFCEKRMSVTCKIGPRGENPDQGRLPGMEKDGFHEIEAVADVKGFSTTADQISFGLTFALASVDVSELVKLAKRVGTMTIVSTESIPEKEKDSPNGDVEEEQ